MFYTLQTTVVLLSSEKRLRLLDEPLESFVPALPLQFCSNYFSALPMVVVHPVTLQKGRGMTLSITTEESVPLQVVFSQTFVGPCVLWDLAVRLGWDPIPKKQSSNV